MVFAPRNYLHQFRYLQQQVLPCIPLPDIKAVRFWQIQKLRSNPPKKPFPILLLYLHLCQKKYPRQFYTQTFDSAFVSYRPVSLQSDGRGRFQIKRLLLWHMWFPIILLFPGHDIFWQCHIDFLSPESFFLCFRDRILPQDIPPDAEALQRQSRRRRYCPRRRAPICGFLFEENAL